MSDAHRATEELCKCGHARNLHSVDGSGGCDSLYCNCTRYESMVQDFLRRLDQKLCERGRRLRGMN
jgi:hypothetical protein